MRALYIILTIFLFINCDSPDDTIVVDNNPIGENPIETAMYFPPLSENAWQTVSPSSLNWNENNLQDLYTYLNEKDTKGFIILKDGKIVVEQYFNNHTQNSNWQWFSVAKSLTSTAIGIAHEEGLLNINNKTSDYLGNNWSSLNQDKQDLITVKHHLTMTSGLQNTSNNFIAWACTLSICMEFNQDAGTVWAYHQGAFTQLQNMISQTSGMNFRPYIREKILDRIGASGGWTTFLNANIFSSNTRSMARFGLLALNKGTWNEDVLVSEIYFNAMTTTSQDLNKAYGYLWWLNGKENFTGTDSEVHNGSLIPNAPDDMFAALGANDQKIYIIPSQNLVVIRCGESAGLEELANSSFDNELWEKINAVIE